MKKILHVWLGAFLFSFLLSPSLSAAVEEGDAAAAVDSVPGGQDSAPGAHDSAPPANGTPSNERKSASPTVTKEKTKKGLGKFWKKLSPEKDNKKPAPSTGSNPDDN